MNFYFFNIVYLFYIIINNNSSTSSSKFIGKLYEVFLQVRHKYIYIIKILELKHYLTIEIYNIHRYNWTYYRLTFKMTIEILSKLYTDLFNKYSCITVLKGFSSNSLILHEVAF